MALHRIKLELDAFGLVSGNALHTLFREYNTNKRERKAAFNGMKYFIQAAKVAKEIHTIALEVDCNGTQSLVITCNVPSEETANAS